MRVNQGITQQVEPSAKKQYENSLSWKHKMAYSLLGNIAAPLAGIATAPILARGLGVEGRGELAAGMAPLILATAIGMLGIRESLTFYVAREPGNPYKILINAAALVGTLGIITSLVIWYAAEPLSTGNSAIATLIKATAVATTLNFLLEIPRAFVAGTQKWQLQAVESFVSGFLRLLLLAVLLVTENLNTFTALVVTLGSPMLSACCYAPYMWRYLKNSKQVSEKPTGYKALINYGIRVWIGAMSGIVLLRIDQFLMVPLSDVEQLGLYAVAVTIGEIPVIISAAMRNVIFSADAEDTGVQLAGTADVRLQQTARIATFLTFATSIMIGVSSWIWLPAIFGTEFDGSIPLLLVLLLAAVIGAPGSVAGAGLSGRGRPGLRSTSMAIGATFNIIVLILLVPEIGAMGGAISTVVGNLFAGSLNVVFMRTVFGHSITSFYGIRKTDVATLTSIFRWNPLRKKG